MLLLMVLVGLIATFLAGASRGSLISLGMAVSVLALAIPFLIFSCVYWLGVTVAGAVALQQRRLKTQRVSMMFWILVWLKLMNKQS